MSANAALLTTASRLAATQNVDNFSAGVAAHINGDLAQHVQITIINQNWVDSCGNHIPNSKRLRILGTFNGVDVAIVLPIVPSVTTTGGGPVITTEPVSQTVGVGASVGFSVVATGTLLRYQWRHNGVPIPGAISPQLALTNVSLNSAGNYDCVVTNAQGIAFSSIAVLTVSFQISIQSSGGGGFFDTFVSVVTFGLG